MLIQIKLVKRVDSTEVLGGRAGAKKKHHSHCIPITQAYTCYSLRKELGRGVYTRVNPPVKLMNMSGFALVKPNSQNSDQKKFSQTKKQKV